MPSQTAALGPSRPTPAERWNYQSHSRLGPFITGHNTSPPPQMFRNVYTVLTGWLTGLYADSCHPLADRRNFRWSDRGQAGPDWWVRGRVECECSNERHAASTLSKDARVRLRGPPDPCL